MCRSTTSTLGSTHTLAAVPTDRDEPVMGDNVAFTVRPTTAAGVQPTVPIAVGLALAPWPVLRHGGTPASHPPTRPLVVLGGWKS